MTATIDLVPSIKSPKALPNHPSKLLTLLWALRLSQFNDYDAEITDIKTVNADWLNLVGDYVDWPEDLAAAFYDVNFISETPSPIGTRQKTKPSKKTNIKFDSFINALNHQPEEINYYLQNTADKLEQHWLKIRDQDFVWNNISLLGNLFDLNDAERKMLLFTIYSSGNRDLREILRETESVSIRRTNEFFAIMLNCTQEQILDAINRKSALISNRILTHLHYNSEWYNYLALSDTIISALTYANKNLDELMSHFIEKPTLGHLEVADIPHLQDSLHMLANVMRNALHNQEHGINILLYGPPGTGKTEFAKLLAQHINSTLYEVSAKDCDGESASGRERYLSLNVAQNYLTGKANTLLLFDEVEDVLAGNPSGDSTGRFGSSRIQSSFSKAWVNQQLENNPVPTLWICNDHEFIDPAHLRRFIFHVELKIPPRSVRQKITERYFKPFNLSKTTMAALSEQSQLSPAQLENTARLLTLNNSTDPQETEMLLKKALINSMSVVGKTLHFNAKQSITPYSLDYLNLDSQVPMARILEGMKKRPQANLCFYGPPGTGKTQLAEYIAEQLDKPLIIKRASDLISPWLGQSEQNIAAMFKEAQSEKALLFLDEADSFLHSRQGMTKSWEVSQVNELLQQMESFNGIFICATNLFDQLDEAALRRFVFKIRFDFLQPKQRINLFAESAGTDITTVSHEHQQRLLKLEQLTPGDFATVLRQADTLGETFTAHELLTQLEKECLIKKGNKSQNNIGFI